jgi:hypothetical protein
MAQGIGQWEKEMLTWARAPASACTKKKKKHFLCRGQYLSECGVWTIGVIGRYRFRFKGNLPAMTPLTLASFLPNTVKNLPCWRGYQAMATKSSTE